MTPSPSHRRTPHARALATLAAGLALAAASPALAASHAATGDAMPAAATPAAGTAPAEGVAMEFTPALSGTWEGGGEVFVNTEQETPFNVKCDITVNATDTTFDLDGECGALFIKRPIRVSLIEEGDAISGTYDADLRTGIADLDGTLEPDGIEMAVTWGGEVNGDTEARMRIERTGDGGLRVLTIDTDPATGEEVTTSDLKLQRADA